LREKEYAGKSRKCFYGKSIMQSPFSAIKGRGQAQQGKKGSKQKTEKESILEKRAYENAEKRNGLMSIQAEQARGGTEGKSFAGRKATARRGI